MSMEFRRDLKLGGVKQATADVAELRKELAAAGGELAKLKNAKPPAAPAAPKPAQPGGPKSPWSDADWAKGPKVSGLQAEIDKGTAALAKEQAAAKGVRDAEKKAKEEAAARAKILDKVGGAGSSLAGPLAAAAGIAGTASLARLALGYRGMAQLQALGLRTQFQFRRLFSGVDPAPAIRAADRFLSSLFSKSSVAGNALSGLFTRSFNGLFQFLEKAQPYATAFFQGMLLGALHVENGWLRVRLALLPVTNALGDAIGPMNGVKIAAVAGAVALGALGLAAAGAAAPFVAAAAAVGELIAQIQQLQSEWDDLSASQIGAQIKRDIGDALGLTSQADRDKAAQMKARGEYERAEARRAAERAKGAPPSGANPAPAAASPAAVKPAGAVTGKAFADGVVEGMKAGASAVEAAGGDLAKAADRGVRKAGQIHSPSKLTRNTGREFPAGVVQGVNDGASDVEDAGRALVPRVPGPDAARASGASSSGDNSSRGPVHLHFHFPNVTSGKAAEDVRPAVREALNAEWRSIALALGLSPELASP